MKKPISIKIDPELLKEARDLAKIEFRSLTSFIEISIKERIERTKNTKKK